MKPLRVLSIVLLASVPLLALALEARTLKWVNLRIGPGRGFALVARLEPGVRVTVEACTPRVDWCKVLAPGARHGWVFADNLSYPAERVGLPPPVSPAVAIRAAAVRPPR